MSELALPKSRARVLFFFFFFCFLVVLVFCCSWAFSSYGEWEPLFTVVCGLLVMVVSLVAEYRLLTAAVSLVVELGLQSVWAQQLWLTDLAALRHGGSS